MPTNCKFVFERQQPVYYSGEQIDGTVHLSVAKRLRLESISLTLLGISHVKWTENSQSLRIERDDCTEIDNKTDFHSTHVNLKQTEVLAGKTVLHADLHYNYQFHFQLPADCAASCTEKYGNVCYKAILKLKRKSKFNKLFEQIVVIKRRYDLNEEQDLWEPRLASSTNAVAKMPIGPVQLMLPRTGFLPGQIIKYRLAIETSDCNYSICTSLRKHVTYRSLEPVMKTKHTTEVIAARKSALKYPHTVRQIEEYELCIPLAIPISSFQAEDLINVNYYLEALILRRSARKSEIMEKLTLPIAIGTEGLSQDVLEKDHEYSYENLGLTIAVNDDLKDQVKAKETQALHCQRASKFLCTRLDICDRIALLALHRNTIL